MPDEATLIDDEIVVAIPDETVVPLKDGAPPPPEKKDPPARVSSLARARVAQTDENSTKEQLDRIASLEREREEARREAEAARLAAAEAAEAARAAQVGRTQAEDTARLREQQAMRAHFARLASDKSQIEGAIVATQAEESNAQAELVRAIESGDAARQAAAQKVIAKAAAQLAQLENGKHAADLEIQRAQRLFEQHEQAQSRATRDETPAPKREPEPRHQPETMTPDRWIDTQARQVLGDKGAEWLKTNRKFADDPKMNRKFLRFADDYADDHGKEALKSEEFIERLNEHFGLVEREEEPPAPVERQQRAPVRATAAAPVSRNGNQFFSSRNMNATAVRLPPALATKVRQMGMDVTQYALQAVEDIKAGRLPKDFLDPDYNHG